MLFFLTYQLNVLAHVVVCVLVHGGVCVRVCVSVCMYVGVAECICDNAHMYY